MDTTSFAPERPRSRSFAGRACQRHRLALPLADHVLAHLARDVALVAQDGRLAMLHHVLEIGRLHVEGLDPRPTRL